MNEIKKAILNQILQIDEALTIDRRLITNDIQYLQQAIEKRKKRHKIFKICLIIIGVFICSAPIYNYYNGLKFGDSISSLYYFVILLGIMAMSFNSNYEMMKTKLESKVFLLKLTHSLNELEKSNS